jgi:hypothetical protein
VKFSCEIVLPPNSPNSPFGLENRRGRFGKKIRFSKKIQNENVFFGKKISVAYEAK